ncbi:MAG: hypothetical protein ABI363_00780 [Nitrosospira sp.]
MVDELGQQTLVDSLDALGRHAEAYFGRARAVLVEVPRPESWDSPERDYFWGKLPPEGCEEAKNIAEHLLTLAGQIADAVRNALLASEADQRDVMTGTKIMRAALFLREFSSWTMQVLHDEDRVLGVQPAGQSDDVPSPPDTASRIFAEWAAKIRDILDLVAASRGLGPVGKDAVSPAPARYRPGTAFIMMSMDKARPELTDVANTVKQVFKEFDVGAVRADDIEHEDLITARILGEIETAEFLFADLTDERPNVYYEIGYAHALKRRVILFRKAGTGLHFDLAGYNCPEYENLHTLREQLIRRLEHLTNRQSKTGSASAAASTLHRKRA